MCGRYALYADPETLVTRFELPRTPDLRPRYNMTCPLQYYGLHRKDGITLTECAIQTRKGTKVTDVSWASGESG